MTKQQAMSEFRQIVDRELPKIRTKWVKGVREFASPADAELSTKLSTRLAALHAVMFPEAK